MSDSSSSRPLFTFEFVGICLVTFLAVCNLTVFYDLFNYLQSLGISAELRGLVIGSYSLTAMFLYLTVSPSVNSYNAPRFIISGMMFIAVSNMAYLSIDSLCGLFALRIMSGAGQFFMGAGTMALFVSVIPPERSGQAFGIYSVALLMAYGSVPAVMDSLTTFIPSPPHGYASMTLTLIPAACLVIIIRKRLRNKASETLSPPSKILWCDIRTNVTQLPIALLILLNMSYFANWSSLFFLFKGFAHEQHIQNVGSFFSVQMGTMIILRLLGGKLFDDIKKVRLVMGSFIIVAIGHFSLEHLPGAWGAPIVGFIFGAGMAIGYPAINGLMFQLSSARFRTLNANLMLFAVQAGFFVGPVIGGALVAKHHYSGYFHASIVLSILAALVCILLPTGTGVARDNDENSNRQLAPNDIKS